MAESPEDKDVDALIDDVQSALDKLKAAQRKDVDDEDSERPSRAKNLQGAERDAYRRLRSARDQADEKSEK